MSIWTAATDLLGRRQCKRCRKMFLPRKEGQEYGPKCARKMAGQGALDDRTAIARMEVLA